MNGANAPERVVVLAYENGKEPSRGLEAALAAQKMLCEHSIF